MRSYLSNFESCLVCGGSCKSLHDPPQDMTQNLDRMKSTEILCFIKNKLEIDGQFRVYS